jgi:hypothetical protein
MLNERKCMREMDTGVMFPPGYRVSNCEGYKQMLSLDHVLMILGHFGLFWDFVSLLKEERKLKQRS